MSKIVKDQRLITISASCAMLPVFILNGVTVFRMLRHESKMYRVIVLILLLMFAEVFWLASQYMIYDYLRDYEVSGKTEDHIERTTIGSMLAVSAVFFDVGHWIFSMTYWSCSKRLELQMQGEDPWSLNKRITILDITLICLNIIVGSVYGWEVSRIDESFDW